MKPLPRHWLVVLLVLASGCAATHPAIVVAPAGPPPFVEDTGAPEGGLAVFSTLESGGGDVAQKFHSAYKIYSRDGRLLKRVNNQTGGYNEDPLVVSLSPGRYQVVAKAVEFGKVTVPVVIEAGKTTMIRLDGSQLTYGGQPASSQFVRLPNGLIIGWQAPDEKKAKQPLP